MLPQLRSCYESLNARLCLQKIRVQTFRAKGPEHFLHNRPADGRGLLVCCLLAQYLLQPGSAFVAALLAQYLSLRLA